MSVTVTYDRYSELCTGYNIGKEILELPKGIIESLDFYYDGKTIDQRGKDNPDNVYVNYLRRFDSREVVIFQTKLLSREEFAKLENSGKLEAWLEQHKELIEYRLSDNFFYFGL